MPGIDNARSWIVAALLFFSGCSAAGDNKETARAGDSARVESLERPRVDSINRSRPGYVIDSILPTEQELRRFRTAVGGDAIEILADASPSREALIRRFFAALAAADTAAFRKMLLTSREFAYLVYPESRYTRPPYRQSPALVWSMIESSTATGLTRLVRRMSQFPVRYVSHECREPPYNEGWNRLWTGCSVKIAQPGTAGESTARLFGQIIERDGRFKFVSYANDF